MVKMALVRLGDRLEPHSQQDRDDLRGLEEGSVLVAKITGVRRQRSYQQLKLFWACCATVADNNDDPSWQTKEQVAFQVKVELRHFSRLVVRDSAVYVEVDSLAFDKLPHLEACRFFDRAWPIMAAKIGVSEDELLKNAADNYC